MLQLISCSQTEKIHQKIFRQKSLISFSSTTHTHIFLQYFNHNTPNHRFILLTLMIPRMCILAIISAVNMNVTNRSMVNVTYINGGWSSNVFGVLIQTETRLRSAQPRSTRRTQFLFTHSMSVLSLRFSSGPQSASGTLSP